MRKQNGELQCLCSLQEVKIFISLLEKMLGLPSLQLNPRKFANLIYWFTLSLTSQATAY